MKAAFLFALVLIAVEFATYYIHEARSQRDDVAANWNDDLVAKASNQLREDQVDQNKLDAMEYMRAREAIRKSVKKASFNGHLPHGEYAAVKLLVEFCERAEKFAYPPY